MIRLPPKMERDNIMNLKILGFSLIELIIVSAIVGIFAAIAAPAYKAYSNKAQMAGIYDIINNGLNTWEQVVNSSPTGWFNISEPRGTYYGGYSIQEFRDLYFPDCTA